MLQSTYIHSILCIYVLCNIVIFLFSSPCQTWWWPYIKGPKHVVSTYIHSMLCIYVLCNIVIFLFSSSCQTWWWPFRKGPKHVVYLLTNYTVIKCCVLTHPPDIILILDIVIAHNGDEPLKDYRVFIYWRTRLLRLHRIWRWCQVKIRGRDNNGIMLRGDKGMFGKITVLVLI